MSVRRSVLEKALEPLEALAFKVERAMENAAMAERLLRAEKLSGMGLLAGGMAHALNNPSDRGAGICGVDRGHDEGGTSEGGCGDYCSGGAADAADRGDAAGVLAAGGEGG